MTYPSRGTAVPAILTLPDLPAYPLVIMCHGHGGSKEEHKGFSTIAEALLRAGIGSIRMDFPGCGESSEPFSKNCLTNMKADVRAALSYVQQHLPVTAIGLFGYSMGGRITLELLAEGSSPDAIALLAPAATAQVMIDIIDRECSFAALKAEAEERGEAALHIGSEIQLLSRTWFTDIFAYGGDPTDAAAAAWQGPSLVLFGEDDVAVPSAVPKAVAKALHAKTADMSGKGHSYGFFAADPSIRENVAKTLADFFSETLCDKLK